MKKLTIISLSGGLDSLATAIKALENNYDLYIVNFHYKQKHDVEVIASQQVYNYLKNKYGSKIIGYKKIDLEPILDDFLFTYTELRDNNLIESITNTKFYTPSRNFLFISLLTTIGEILAMKLGYDEVAIGLGIHKHSENVYRTQYWDITPEFSDKINEVLVLNKNILVRLFTPFVDQSKDKIIKFLKDRNIPFSMTWTCYDPKVSTNGQITIYKPCNECESCRERLEAGTKAGVPDINQYMIVTVPDYVDDDIFDC